MFSSFCADEFLNVSFHFVYEVVLKYKLSSMYVFTVNSIKKRLLG